jgi:hypothetical protein
VPNDPIADVLRQFAKKYLKDWTVVTKELPPFQENNRVIYFIYMTSRYGNYETLDRHLQKIHKETGQKPILLVMREQQHNKIKKRDIRGTEIPGHRFTMDHKNFEFIYLRVNRKQGVTLSDEDTLSFQEEKLIKKINQTLEM